MIKYSPSKRIDLKGFSLIELMVAIGLMLIIFTVAVPNYRTFQRSRSLESAYQNLVSDLRMAQESAMSGKKPQDALSPCVSNPLEGYFVDSPNTDRYRIQVLCSTYYLIKNVKLADITVTSFTSFGFKPLGGGTTIAAGTSQTIRLTQTSTGAFKDVTIESGGEIH